MSWLLLAFIAPIFWAWAALLDTYLVHGVYDDAEDGAIISGVFQSTPWLLVPLGVVDFSVPESSAAALALASGGLFLLSILSYFKALFLANDTALMQVLWNLAVPVVPFVAWLLIGETLLPSHYMGIALAFVGIASFSFDARVRSSHGTRIVLAMLSAVALLSLSMVLGKKAYQLCGDSFWNVYLLFSAGAAGMALLLAFLGRGGIAVRNVKVIGLGRRFFLLFLLGESLSLLGTTASQRAISLAPAVSFVAVIESLTPVFIMLSSLFFALFVRSAARQGLESVWRRQLTGLKSKMLAILMISVGIYVIA